MSELFDNVGDYVTDHMTGTIALIVFIGLPLVVWLFILACTAVYAFMREEKVRNPLLRAMYTIGKYLQERPNRGRYQGGSVIALYGVNIIYVLLILANIVLIVLDMLQYIDLGTYVYIPITGILLVVTVGVIYTKAHLKRWGFGEYTLSAPEPFQDPFADPSKRKPMSPQQMKMARIVATAASIFSALAFVMNFLGK